MYFLLILSHSKSKFRENQRGRILDANNSKFIFYYFVGDLTIDSEYVVDELNQIVYLKVADNYESLSLKTYYALKFISEKYPNVSGVFKTDDDIDLDLDKIYNCIVSNRVFDYFGLVVNSPEYESTYHFGKCESSRLNSTPMNVPKCLYCAGGGYYLSMTSIIDIKNNKTFFDEVIFEDVAVGATLNRCNTFPVNVDIKNNGCAWGDHIITKDSKPPDEIIYFQIPNKVNQSRCKCGEIKNKMLYNFCQKCNKLY